MKTKAVVLYEVGKPLVIEDIELPVLQTGQVLVKILYSGICRSQLHEIEGSKGEDKYLPHMLGHEAGGIVIDIGNDVSNVNIGEHVVVSWIKGLGMDIPSTKYGNINAGAVTTFSEYTIVSENRVTKIPADMPLDIAALLGCAVPTGGGIILNQLGLYGSLAVIGAGGIGLSSILLARLMKFNKIIAIDISEDKLALAEKLGATDIINSRFGDFSDMLKNSVDYAIDTAGTVETIEGAFRIVKWDIWNNGLVVIAGNPPNGEKISIDPFELKGKQIIGSWGGLTKPEIDIPIYVNYYLTGQLNFDDMITNRYKLDEINQAFQDMRDGKIIGRAILEL